MLVVWSTLLSVGFLSGSGRHALHSELRGQRGFSRGLRAAAYSADAASSDEGCDLDARAALCTYDRAAINARFRDEPLEVAGRLASVAVAVARVNLAHDEGATLRAELSRLGPVFCKVGQTMATRPDIIGLETSRNLGQLQDAIAPEADGPAVAMRTLAEALGRPIEDCLMEVSPEPVAAASLAEVYKARLVSDGRAVAVKIQRPGLERKVALDFYVLGKLLELAQRRFNIGYRAWIEPD